MSENIFWTSDTHYGHKLMARLRGFYTANKDNFAPVNVIEDAKREMDEVLIKNWNEVVRRGDIVYHLGDVSFRDAKETATILRRLNGTIRLVRGNHDKIIKGDLLDRFDWVKDYYEGRGPDKRKIIMCHTAFLVWNKSHRGSWNLCGHSHGSLPFRDAKQMDVGVDTNDLQLYSMEDVEKIMSKRGVEVVDHHG